MLGILAEHHEFALEAEQRNAWREQIAILKAALDRTLNGHLLLEFTIPRIGKRADAVLLLGGYVIVLEFKVGAHGFEAAVIDQETRQMFRAYRSYTIQPMTIW